MAFESIEKTGIMKAWQQLYALLLFQRLNIFFCSSGFVPYICSAYLSMEVSEPLSREKHSVRLIYEFKM